MAKKDEVKETKKEKVEGKNLPKSQKVKKEKTKNNKKKVQKENYFAGVKSEMSKVKWPSKQEVLKYTLATIIFMIVLVIFFLLMDLIMSVIKGAFN